MPKKIQSILQALEIRALDEELGKDNSKVHSIKFWLGGRQEPAPVPARPSVPLAEIGVDGQGWLRFDGAVGARCLKLAVADDPLVVERHEQLVEDGLFHDKTALRLLD